ncbi:MAG TPA: M24 family metallopeptidase [Bacillota bacterium]|nr:M24 family metallopeptidase [Bacillota bacterium]HOL11856.1 M24 family metallopeptidase [Bacillota bacterium]
MKNACIIPLREQAKVRNSWLEERFRTILPRIMDREGFDMWIISGREYNEDPVMMSMFPQPMMSARRRTMLVFYRERNNDTDKEKGNCEEQDGWESSDGLEKITIARGRTGLFPMYEPVWIEEEPDEWHVLARIVEERDPKSIGINVSEVFAFGDGLSHSEYVNLMEALGPIYRERVRSAERLALGWLETRLAHEIWAYTEVVRICHDIINEGFSRKVIIPGVTTASDVAWWMRQTMCDMGLDAWFQPSVDVQRFGVGAVNPNSPILPGDLLHCDVGFYYLGLASDVQQNAYVLKLGEDSPPLGLVCALATGNKMQDIVMGQMRAGRTGNQILQASLKEAEAQGIKGSVYCHPIGYHGHAAGPTIGLWDHQEGVPGRGDYELFEDTCHALELNIRQEVKEWHGQEITIALEEDIVFTGNKGYFLDGRQEEFHLI